MNIQHVDRQGGNRFQGFADRIRELTQEGITIAKNVDPYFKALMYAILGAIEATENGRHNFKFKLEKAYNAARTNPWSSERSSDIIKEIEKAIDENWSVPSTELAYSEAQIVCMRTITLFIQKAKQHEMVNYESGLNILARTAAAPVFS